MNEFIGTQALAQIANLSKRAAEKALTRALQHPLTTWRGAALVVRTVPGRGGRSGQRYEVRSDSLPVDLQERLKAIRSVPERRLIHGEKAQAERDWWYGVIEPALGLAKHSHERAAAIRAIGDREHMRPSGKRVKLSESTIRRKLEDYDLYGLAGLSRAGRSDDGRKRTIISRSWDTTMCGMPDAWRGATADRLKGYLKSLHKANMAVSEIQLHASDILATWTAQAGCGLDPEALKKACRLPFNVINAPDVRRIRKVHEYKTDRKSYEDTKAPRVRGSYDGMLPMDLVTGDVHHVDIAVRREDGSEATPKLIAWFDVATNRLWVTVVLLRRGEGIRNEHVIASFIEMVEAWGAPRALYLDNGSEYNWAPLVDDALKLVDREGMRLIGHIQRIGRESGSQVHNALPYNAPGKPGIEGTFGLMERYLFSAVKGWIGGDRLRKKTDNVGRPSKPYPHGFDALRDTLKAQVEFYEVKPQGERSKLKGLSPRQATIKAVAAGWKPIAVDRDMFTMAFTARKTVRNWQGSLRVGGQTWTSPELQECLDDAVSVAIPKYGMQWPRLPFFDRQDKLLGFVEPDSRFDRLDPAGAEESGQRRARKARAVRKLDRSTPDIDVLALRADYVAKQPPAPKPPAFAMLTASDEAREIATRVHQRPGDLEWQERGRRARKALDDLERTENFARRLTGTGS